MKSLESNIWKFYAYRSIGDPSLLIPVFVIFLLGRGLSFTQILIIQAVFSAAVMIFEIPSGALADLWGRKKMIVLGMSLFTLGMFIYVIGNTFTVFLIAELIAGIGLSFTSGADHALLYDSLKSLNREHEYAKILGYGLSYSFALAAFTSILAGVLASININWPVYGTVIMCSVAVMITFSFIEPPLKKKSVSVRTHMQQMRHGFNFAVTHKRVRWLTAYSMIFLTFGIAAFWFYQPYMQAVNIDLLYFGVFFAAFNVVAAFASRYSHAIEQRIGEFASLLLIPGVTIAALFLMRAAWAWWGVFFIFLFRFAHGFGEPVISGYTNKYIKSSERATVLSVKSFFDRGLFILIGPLFGLIADSYGLQSTFVVMGVVLTVIVLGLFAVYRK